MKKFATIVSVITAPSAAFAQGNYSSGIDKEIFNACASMLVLILFMLFILAIVKRILEHRLKNKIVDKGIAENIASSILETNPKEDQNINIKWFALLTGIGAGLTIVNYSLPLGIHSLAIMSFCIAASFLGYFFFVRRTER